MSRRGQVSVGGTVKTVVDMNPLSTERRADFPGFCDPIRGSKLPNFSGNLWCW